MMGKILLVVVALTLFAFYGVRAACNHLLSGLSPVTMTTETSEVAGGFEDEFGVDVPLGYKGAFAMDVGLFGVQAARIIGLIPADTEPAAIFEGGTSIKFNPGEHTIVLAARFQSGDSEEKSRRDLQRLVLGDDGSDAPLTEVFIPANDRKIAAYEHRDTRYGQENLSYFVFLDDGGLVFFSGPANGFDHAMKQSLAASLAATHPANELLYAHVEAPTRDPHHPCGFENLPEKFEIQAIGIRRGSTELDGVAVDPEDDDAGAQTVAVGRTDAPVVLILMSGEPTVWKVKTTTDSRIAGVIASGRGRQRVIGLERDVQLKEIDPHDRNACPPFLTYEPEGREYDRFADRIWEVFAQGVSRLHSQHGGDHFRVGELTGEPVPKGDLRVEDVVLSPSDQLLPGKLGLDQLEKDGVIRPARSSDLDSWLANLTSRDDPDPERYRSRFSSDLRGQRAFVIHAQTDMPRGMAGANSALFLVAEGVPDPSGDLGHNTFLYADGRCLGPACPR